MPRFSMTRRDFLSAVGGGLALGAGSVWPGARPLWAAETAPTAAAKRPNILVMMADDMGFSDLGCYGSEIETPNLSRLAARGIRFTQFYNTARCCPTRASLLTGLYPHQAGIGHMVDDKGLEGYQGRLNNRCATLAEVLRQGGYRTLMAGKWHVGEKRPHWPCDRGFDRYWGLISGACNYWRLEPGRQMARDNEPIKPEGEKFYMTDAFADHAIEMLHEDGRGPKPFFMYLAFTSPHWPLHAWPEDIAKYKGKYIDGWDALRERRRARMIEMGLLDKRWPLTPRDPAAPPWENVKDKDAMDIRMAVYAAQIDRMDQNVGRVVKKLEELGTLDNTLILFLADNGGCAEAVNKGKEGVPPGPVDSYMSYGRPWANASNTPFRLYKHWVHEGGIATPLIAHWPARIRQGGGLTPEIGHLIDIMATCCDVGGVEYPKTLNGREVLPLEGKTLAPIFDGRERPGHDAIFWEHEGNRAVRQGKWKLVSKHPGGWELYDMEADRSELNNLAAKEPDREKGMIAAYDAWAARCGVVPWAELQKKAKAAATK
jgi:arylsulfatase